MFNLKGARVFIAAIADLLAPGGRALIDDLPTTNAKVRNARAADAASQSAAWQDQIDPWRRNKGDAHPFDEFAGKSRFQRVVIPSDLRRFGGDRGGFQDFKNEDEKMLQGAL